MATLKSAALMCAVLAAASCTDKLAGLQDTLVPLGRVHVAVKGNLQPLRPIGTENETPRLRVALVWGQSYVAETFCWLHALPGDPSATAVAAAGCRDVTGFVPQLVAANAAVDANGSATLDLLTLPTAEVMVGTVDSRIAYGSVLVYDDRDGNGTLDLHRPPQAKVANLDGPGGGGDGGGGGGMHGPVPEKKRNADFVYGASFVSMTLPDKRIAFREGTFAESAFYPRYGCPAPPVGFSVLGAGGFSIADVLLALTDGKLPAQTACATETLDQAVVEIALQPTETVRDVACGAGQGGGNSGMGASSASAGSARYLEPPVVGKGFGPDLAQPWLCQSTLPKAKPDKAPPANPPKENLELVIALPPTDCKGLAHYVLRGCSNDANCASPQWDLTTHPPPWWPCPTPGGPKP